MSMIEFDGVQIDVDTVRRKLEKYDNSPVAEWPVWITDSAGAALLVNSIGGIYMMTPGFPSGYFFGRSVQGARGYLTEVLNAVGEDMPSPPLASDELIRLGAVKYGDEARAMLIPGE